jgi:alpha-ribazole phosphatase
MGSFHTIDVYLVRHGVTSWNIEKRYLGHTDEPLVEHELYKLNPLRSSLKEIPFDRYYSSDLKRCTETFRYLIGDKLVCLDSRIRELDFGKWEGMTYEMLKGDVSYQDWLNNWEHIAPPGGETLAQLNARINAFLADLLIQNKDHNSNVLILTHGGVIRAILKKFEQTKSFWELMIQHGKAYHLSFQQQKGEWVCNSLSVVPIQEKEN